jgi:hypothetical protein
MEVSGQLHAPAPLAPEKELVVPLGRRLGGPQSRSGRDGEEKNSQPLPGLEPQIILPVARRCTAEVTRSQSELSTVSGGSLSPRHGASSGCGWRRLPQGVEGNCECIELSVADSRQGVVFQLGCWAGVTTANHTEAACQEMLLRASVLLIWSLKGPDPCSWSSACIGAPSSSFPSVCVIKQVRIV